MAHEVLPKAGANLFSLMWELLQENKISSDHQSNTVVSSMGGKIILDCWIKTMMVELLESNSFENHTTRGHNQLHPHSRNISMTYTFNSDILVSPSPMPLGIQINGTFKPCDDCALGKAKQWAVSKKAVPCSKILGERLFFDISYPYTPTFDSKQHWLLVIDDSSNVIWTFFLNKKSDPVDTMVGLVKNLNNKCNLQVQYFHCNNAGEKVAFKKACKQEGLGVDFEYTASGMP